MRKREIKKMFHKMFNVIFYLKQSYVLSYHYGNSVELNSKKDSKRIAIKEVNNLFFFKSGVEEIIKIK